MRSLRSEARDLNLVRENFRVFRLCNFSRIKNICKNLIWSEWNLSLSVIHNKSYRCGKPIDLRIYGLAETHGRDDDAKRNVCTTYMYTLYHLENKLYSPPTSRMRCWSSTSDADCKSAHTKIHYVAVVREKMSRWMKSDSTRFCVANTLCVKKSIPILHIMATQVFSEISRNLVIFRLLTVHVGLVGKQIYTQLFWANGIANGITSHVWHLLSIALCTFVCPGGQEVQ
jgi:hypothetical protein